MDNSPASRAFHDYATDVDSKRDRGGRNQSATLSKLVPLALALRDGRYDHLPQHRRINTACADFGIKGRSPPTPLRALLQELTSISPSWLPLLRRLNARLAPGKISRDVAGTGACLFLALAVARDDLRNDRADGTLTERALRDRHEVCDWLEEHADERRQDSNSTLAEFMAHQVLYDSVGDHEIVAGTKER
jgi:hypothetical protein